MVHTTKSNVAPAARAIARQETLRQNRLAASRSFPCPTEPASRESAPKALPSVFFFRFAAALNSRDRSPPLFFSSQYFVSSGFAFVHADSTTDICAVEAVPVEQLDAEAVKKGLADYQAKLVNAKDDYEKASAQIGIEVCGAMNSALGN
jgi:hypothetical protein